jgi:hypothetical protein
MHLALLLPDGVGVRNFVLGSFLDHDPRVEKIHVFHVIPEDHLTTYASPQEGRVVWHPMIGLADKPLPYLLRQSLNFAQMFWVDNFAMQIVRDRPIGGSWKTKTVMNAARLLGRASASPRSMQRLDRWHARAASRAPEVQHYRSLFQKTQPTVLFCSHQRPATVIPAVLAAKSLGIPTATFIYSWDNLSSKGRIAAPFDHYLLWSDHMKGELLRFYPDVSPDRAHVVGTPQFDPYGDEKLLVSKQEFCRQLGADPTRPLICFSGGDAGNSREDHHHVRLLMELIRSGRIGGNPQVILRPAPVDEGTRYDSVRRDFPELIYAQPEWLNTDSANWSAVMPLPKDIAFLANLTNHADLNINFASTMTLDFAIRDKPVINLVIDTCDPPTYGVSQWDFVRQYEHYQPVIEFGAARFAHSADDLAEHVNAYLQDPSLDREGRKKFVELEVSVPIGESCQRVIDVLSSISSSHRTVAT